MKNTWNLLKGVDRLLISNYYYSIIDSRVWFLTDFLLSRGYLPVASSIGVNIVILQLGTQLGFSHIISKDLLITAEAGEAVS